MAEFKEISPNATMTDKLVNWFDNRFPTAFAEYRNHRRNDAVAIDVDHVRLPVLIGVGDKRIRGPEVDADHVAFPSGTEIYLEKRGHGESQ